MTDERSLLLASIATTSNDYREGDAGVIAPTPEHVDRWACQFGAESQVPVLREVDHVLKRTYYAKIEVSEYLGHLITNEKLVTTEPSEFWSSVSFLDIQKNGSSQRALLEIFDGRLQDALGLQVTECGSSKGPFVYLDDAIFSGDRAGGDLRSWINEKAPAEATVHIVVIASHTLGSWQLTNWLKDVAQAAGKTISFRVWRAVCFENRKAYRMHSEVLWPVELPEDELVRRYADSIVDFPFEPRPPGGRLENPIFSSEEGRQLLEQEFLLAGVRIRAACHNPATVTRPLGYSDYALGFGSMIVTFRNCPNNAPLALWWGDADARPGSALDWYPLFARKTYEDRR